MRRRQFLRRDQTTRLLSLTDMTAKARKLRATEESAREIATFREIELRFGDPFR